MTPHESIRRRVWRTSGDRLANGLLVALLLLTIAGAIGACDALLPPNLSASDPGASGVELAINRYVAGANAGDAAAIARILGGPRPVSDIEHRLAVHGGLDIHDLRLTVSSEFPRIYQVTIDATTRTSEAISWREVVEWTGSGWHFAVLTR